jgi:hypothetical protein
LPGSDGLSFGHRSIVEIVWLTRVGVGFKVCLGYSGI